MTVRKARSTRKRLCKIFDSLSIYPRWNDERDAVSYALLLRMLELHESICLLAIQGKRRDAVILGRTLCEANISYYWLSNKDMFDRCKRYVKFGARVRAENVARVKEYFDLDFSPETDAEEKILKEADDLFGRAIQWNQQSIRDMADEKDEYDPNAKDVSRPSNAQYRLFYYWCSLLSHPSVEAIKNFFPPARTPFRTTQAANEWQSLPERYIVFLATIWLFAIVLRIDRAKGLDQEEALQRIWNSIKLKRERATTRERAEQSRSRPPTKSD